MHRQAGCLISAATALAATVLPWSSTAAAGRNGWETASLALALDEVVHEPLLAGVASLWYLIPVAGAVALCVALLMPRRASVLALRAAGVLIVLDVLTLVVAMHRIGTDVALPGPLLALAGGVALVTLPARLGSWSFPRRMSAASTGAHP